MNTSLIGNWKLAGDTNDSSGNGNHGQQSSILVPNSSSLQIGTNDFSISARIFTEERLGDPIGDIVVKFDADRRNGFNLGLKRHSGSGTSLTNYRNVHFGIDNGYLDPEWTDCGQLVMPCS